MTENDATSLYDLRSRRPARRDTTGERTSMGSHDTGESSNPGSLLNHTQSTDATLALPSDELSRRPSTGNPRDSQDAIGHHRKDAKNASRGHKHRSSGAFLLQDAILQDVTKEPENGHPMRHSRNLLQSSDSKSLATSFDQPISPPSRDLGLGIDVDGSSSRPSTTSADSKRDGTLTVRKRAVVNGKTPAKSVSVNPAIPSLDADSAQIINMALNLSESRRIASRRNVSNPVPPKLAPLPDAAAGGSLRQHLQQQRKISRTVSPRPDRSLMPRVSSGVKVTSPLQAAFDLGHEGSYRYHFSASTIARAQKAKEYLELMAQYRRILQFVPPLKPSGRSRITLASPPGSPIGAPKPPISGNAEVNIKLGRQYNPLQYIRNRKVRARERLAIDGDAQGFGELVKVTEWADEIESLAESGDTPVKEAPVFPPFFDNGASLQASPQPGSGKTAAKPKRPRVDWEIDPSDMLADIYWLEQDNNKQLIEDRHWRRVFPQSTELCRPLSQQTDEPFSATPPPKKDISEPEFTPETKPLEPALVKQDTDHSHSSHHSARERARQKLHDLKGLHHRHNSSVHSHHDFLRFRRGSISDLSDSDLESKERRARSGTITSSSKDILQKQMVEMIAKEARENELQGFTDSDIRRMKGAPLMTPDRDRESFSFSKPPTRLHSRAGSFADASESDERPARQRTRYGSPFRHRPGRPSLDVPMAMRSQSFDSDTSLPNSPDLRPIRDSTFVPAIGMDLSPPSSRQGSPTRNPFTKVKQIFRDRSRERGYDSHADDDADQSVDSKQAFVEAPEPPPERKKSPERRASKSPARKIITARITVDGNKLHRGVGSLRNRGDMQSSGIKGLLRGARIDNVIRGGVSKLGELIWRKDHAGSESEDTSTDESDTEPTRGRKRNLTVRPREASPKHHSQLPPHSGKSYMDSMPTFQSALEAHDQLHASGNSPLLGPGTPSRQPSRFDLLKPPRIDVQSASPSASPPLARPRHGGSDHSDTDSRGGSRLPSYMDAVMTADERLNNVINMPPSFSATRRHRSSMSTRGRHWSISDRSPSLGRAPMSKREVARLKALILSSGIKAMEISRRANDPQLIFSADAKPTAKSLRQNPLRWSDLTKLSPETNALQHRTVRQTEVYSVAANTIGASIQRSGQEWQATADKFVMETSPLLQRKVDDVRTRITMDLSAMTRAAADEADETNRDLVLSQRLKVKRVVDIIEKMLRRRRRRFRWLRRGLWIGVEWVLVGFMWYVWFVVMILRIFLGIGQGFIKGVKWLLWL
jgi:hypothetical protein